MGRLIDESELIDIIQGSDEITNYQKDECITCIRACNTAYDPDKVVEQLESLSNAEADYYYAWSNDVIDREDAIDIVKKGGGADAEH